MRTRIFSTAALLTVAGFAAEGPSSRDRNIPVAPVLRNVEQADSGIIRLPAPPPSETVAPKAPAPETQPTPTPKVPAPEPMVAAPIEPATPPSETPVPTSRNPRQSPVDTHVNPVAPALPKAVKPVLAASGTSVPPQGVKPSPRLFLPQDFARDSANYCQRRIGEWTEPDVYNLFGDPLRQRSAPNDGKKEDSGRILAFADPTGRYREIELDFAPETGLLRSVFVYPWQMTWQECRRLWDGNVTSTKANKGRIFYSYLNRRLDVLVGPDGKVVSFGLY